MKTFAPVCWHQDADTIYQTLRLDTQCRLDANESIFFARQLEYISNKLFEVKYPERKARRHFPVSFDGGNAVEQLTYRATDRLGKAKIVSNYAKDFPRVTTISKEITNRVKTLGDSYGYDIQKIRAAQYANISLEAREAMAARLAIVDLENQLAYTGDPDSQINGFLNHPLVPISVAANTIGAASTNDQIVEVFRQAILGVFINSRGVESVDSILLPLTPYTYLQTKQLNTTNSDTVLDYLKKVFPGVGFDWCNECSGAGPGGTDVMFAYVKDDMHMTLQIPSDFEQLAPFTDGANWEIKCMERFAGAQVHYPTSALITILV